MEGKQGSLSKVNRVILACNLSLAVFAVFGRETINCKVQLLALGDNASKSSISILNYFTTYSSIFKAKLEYEKY